MTASTTPSRHARPHLTTHTRSLGHSAVAGAAYRLGLKLTDQRTGDVHDFRKRKLGEEIVRAVTVAPPGSPAWATNPQELWNRVELSEKRKDSQVAHDYRVPIPFGLTDTEAGDLAEELARFISDELDVPVSVGLHRDADRDALGMVKPPDKQGFHAHLYFPTRAIEVGASDDQASDGRTGFGPKLMMLSHKKQASEWIEYFNAVWAERCNNHLGRAGKPEIIDHRSYKRQGVAATPQPKMGVSAAALERRGISSIRGDVLREALVMAEVHRRVQVATATAAATASPAGAPLSVIKPAGASGTPQRIPVQIPAAVPVSGSQAKRSTPRNVEPRRVRTGVRIRTAGGAPGLKTSLAQKVAAAGSSPKTEAERLALERAIEFAAILDAVLQTYSAQLKEHAHLVEQARRVQQHALELSHRIEDSRKKRERARQAVRDLTVMHPIRTRLSKAGLPVKDPRQAKIALAAHHDRHVQEDKRAHRSLLVREGVAWEQVKAARAELDRRKEALKAAVGDLATKDMAALTQLLGFLPEDAAGWVRDAMKAAAAESNGSDVELLGQAETLAHGQVVAASLRPRVP